MKLHDLIQKHAWKDIETALVRLYPEHESELVGYQRVFETLRSLPPVLSSLKLLIQLVYSEHTREFDIEVKGIGPNQEDGGAGSIFALELRPWPKWLGMELEAKTLEEFSEFDIVAHCLYEMTFFGFTQEDIQTASSEISDHGLGEMMQAA
ncbi:MAG: hypothetical protein Fur0022_31400 [Anaerolineales bacterium]